MWSMLAASKAPRGGRRGFTVVELMLVIVISGILLGAALPNFTDGRRQAHVDRATRVLAMDLRLASSLAARTRRPVEVRYDADRMSLTISDERDGTVHHTRDFGPTSDFDLSSLDFSEMSVEIAPSGLASSGLDIAVEAGGYSRRITMLRGGVVRVVPR